jgi:hypothetical protein
MTHMTRKADPGFAGQLAALAGGRLAPIARIGPMVELGTTGLRRTGGFISEERLPQLSGDKALAVYREMRDNSSAVGALLFVLEMLARGTGKRVEAGGESNADNQAKELILSSLDDMSMSWPDTLSEILSCAVYGFSYHELVYKVRQGQQSEPGKSSHHDDGFLSWRKWPIRAQETRWRWEFADDGGLSGMHQLDPATGTYAFIPLDKALLFRLFAYKNNPEGRSLLRNAYRPWFFLKRIQEYEAIGIERDLAGLPVMRIPAQVMSDDTQMEKWKKLVADIKRNEQAGVVIPSDMYGDTDKPQYELTLLTSGGERQVPTDPVVKRYESDILKTAIADFIQLGNQEVGARSLGDTKAQLFATSVNALLDSVAGVINRHAIPRVMALNGLAVEQPPHLVFDDVEFEDVVGWAEAVAKMTGAGMPLFPDPVVENVVRSKLDFPELTEDEIEQRKIEDEQRAQEQEAMDREAAKTELDGARAEMERTGADAERMRAEARRPTKTEKAVMIHTGMMDMPTAIKELKQAIALHEQHLEGTAPTTGTAGRRSQLRMMRMMERALTALGVPDEDEDGEGKKGMP